jgi:sarcosine oxidase subunit alpha
MRITSHKHFPVTTGRREIFFSFNGKSVIALEGDTIASALFAAGVRIFSRSFKYHRPRGLYDNNGQGSELLLTVNHEPNVRADKRLVEAGMEVKTQNAWPSVDFDLMAVNDTLVPLLPNGFYYKMFHKPKWIWPIAEKQIRKAAGLGKIDSVGHHVNARYEKIYRFPDICIVGSGPAGLAAARAALAENKQVLLIEEEPELGGHSRHTLTSVEGCSDQGLNGKQEHEAIRELIDAVSAEKNLEILANTTAFAVYEDNLVTAHNGRNMYKIRAGAVVVAAGATDRHLVFNNNDRPGIMTARGVETLIMQYAIKPANKAVIVTSHDGGYHTAKLLEGAGTEIVAILDGRDELSGDSLVTECQEKGIPIYLNETVHGVIGKKHVKQVIAGDLTGKNKTRKIDCDSLIIAAGFKPQLQLLSMGRAKPFWDCQRKVYRFDTLPEGLYCAGEVNGHASFSTLYREGWETGKAAAERRPQPASRRDDNENIEALPADIASSGKRHFICKCMDVTRKEMCDSIAEGFDQVETLKRYTSMGMGPCQGKSCYEAVARLAAEDTGREQKESVPTTMRPPYAPVPLGVLAGRSHHLVPIRRTPMHACHEKRGARFLNAGFWKRPYSYGNPQDEATHVRNKLGMIDVSTLGKIELSGPDVLDFLHFMLPGKYAGLQVGKTRYVTMITEDGIFYEDGTLSHIEQGRYYLSTTTGNQDAIVSRFWWWITTDHFNIQLKNVSSAYAAVNVAGQSARKFLQKVVEIDMSNDAFGYMTCRNTRIGSVPVMLFRIGFTGELSYEIHYPAEYGESMWEFLLEEGKPFELKPFGVEAQRILRLEKGHLIPSVDTDALSNPYEAGIGFTVKDDKPDFLGKAFLDDFKTRGIENRLIAYKLQAGDPIPSDGVAVLDGKELIGRVTSSRMSPTVGCGIGLAWVAKEYSDVGSRIQIRLANGRDVFGDVIDHAAYDPEGVRLKA